MGFDLLDVTYETISELRSVVRTVERSDRDLARQIRRAASSIAHGSASEVRVALQVALAWGILDAETVRPIDSRLDRIGAMCWRLSGR